MEKLSKNEVLQEVREGTLYQDEELDYYVSLYKEDLEFLVKIYEIGYSKRGYCRSRELEEAIFPRVLSAVLVDGRIHELYHNGVKLSEDHTKIIRLDHYHSSIAGRALKDLFFKNPEKRYRVTIVRASTPYYGLDPSVLQEITARLKSMV